MTRATFMDEARIEYCPTGECGTAAIRPRFISFRRLLENGISIKVTASVFHAAVTTINAKDQVVSVPKGGLKFTVEFNKWPITDAGNDDDQLQLMLQVDTSSGGFGDYSLVDKTDADNMKTIVFGTDTNTAGSYMDIPTLALLDGANAPVTATFQSGILKLVFPMFTTNLVYDPVLSSNNVNAQIPPIVALKTPTTRPLSTRRLTSGQVVKAVLGGLGRYNAAGDSEGFLGISTADAWTDIVKSKEGTVDVSTTTITTDFGNSKTLKVTAMVFHADGTTMSGNAQTVNVPAGALKFSLELNAWPFDAGEATDTMRFTMEFATTSKTAGTTLAAPTLAAHATDPKMKTVTLGEGMYMDIPTIAQLDDGDDKDITVALSGDGRTLTWTFPKFTSKLVYDPVLDSTDSTATTPAPVTQAPVPTTKATTTPAPSAASVMTAAATLVAGVAALFYAYF